MQSSYLIKLPSEDACLCYSFYLTYMAEREGFEPPIALRLCLISSQVHSTGLCHLSANEFPLFMLPNVHAHFLVSTRDDSESDLMSFLSPTSTSLSTAAA